MKFGIRLYSKYTGELVTILGWRFNTSKAATEFANNETNICSRCHRWELEYISDDEQWVNRHKGFLNKEQIKKLKE